MNLRTLVLTTGVFACAASAQVTIRLSSETAPPGGMAQLKVQLTSPQPISSGWGAVDFSGCPIDSIDGIALFNSAGTVMGAAVIDGQKPTLRFISTDGSFGSVDDYPLMTFAVSIRPDAAPGQFFLLSIDPQSQWLNLLGSQFPIELQPGAISIGGSVSITNVIPGGGIIAGGSTFDIVGIGFSPKTSVSIRGLNASSVTYISPTLIRATVRETGILDGTLIQVRNPDNSADSYYSYMRGIPVGQSIRPLLQRTVPVFSTATATEALLPAPLQLDDAKHFTAVAFQNPSSAPATISLQAVSSTGQVTSSTQLILSPGYRITRQLSELGLSLPAGGNLHLLSTAPIQLEGLLGDDQAEAVTPAAFAIVSPASAQPSVPSDPGVSHNGGASGGSGGGGGGNSGGSGGSGKGN